MEISKVLIATIIVATLIKVTNPQRPVKFNTKHITSPCHLCDPWEDNQRHTRGRNELNLR